MPFVRIDLREGKTPEYRAAVGEVVYQAMRAHLSVPERDLFQIITEHPPSGLNFDREYLGIQRSVDCIFLQITLAAGRTSEAKRTFYKAVADGFHEAVQLRREDVFINLVEVQREDWSFGNGEAQYIALQ